MGMPCLLELNPIGEEVPSIVVKEIFHKISTNNIAIGLVRVRKIRFQPTKYVFVRRCARSRRSFVRVTLAQARAEVSSVS
jgi:hypothetical protein